ncbi:toxin [Pseudomonas frederiksbergensis]|uniref:Toxin n=1 Tax=Pseudomonas frederiksbergensis TaxID=104087 RepID=A0A423KI05_9PSED|nr:membrane-targeted effector domain-containing toxin [Pseudomonas frederiksbergensis]RON52793.1 toxin [Pseudomonas frederiksbergensis]
MSTPTAAPSFEEIKGYLNQIGHHLLKTETPLLPDQKPSAEQVYLNRLNGLLKNYREQFMRRSRTHYQALAGSDLQSTAGQALLATVKASLNTHLADIDLRELIDGKPAKSFMTFEAGFTAIENEARLDVQDRLLHPQAGRMLASLTLAPPLRPGLYALQFSYQDHTVELAGAFVATEKNSPVVHDLSDAQNVGHVLLFTPSRGIESFDSLAELDGHLQQHMLHSVARDEFLQMLPVRFHALSAEGIWPLQLSPIDSAPLFEHLYDAKIAKRAQDIERALSFVDNLEQDPARLTSALDRAIGSALPDLTLRLELRAQTLLERSLRLSAPDWYRSASATRRAELAVHLGHYNQARQGLLDLLGPATNPQSLARHQWLEQLGDDLEIHDLEPQHLWVSTRRHVPGFGVYEHQHNLIDLALRGLHTGDELPGSDFLGKTTLRYRDAPLPESYKDLTPAWLAQQLTTLQPRVDFANVQTQLHARPELQQAIEHMLDQRINALAFTAVMQGHLQENDFQLIQRLRAGSDPQLSAATLGAGTLSLHGAQLQDLWVLRQVDADGAIKRLLLCTPEAPRDQQFQAFDTELACQQHLLGWARDVAVAGMGDYLISRAPLRFRHSMQQVLSGLSDKPGAHQQNEVTFAVAASQGDCLKSMAAHVLATRVDDYDFSTPLWYRSASVETRRKLATLAEDAEGALRTFDDHPLSQKRFPSFEAYLHEQARKSLNTLLQRTANDVDPDTVWALSPPAIVGNWTPAPLTYTQLYRDGYADGVGFLDEKFSRSARFKGPPGVDLSLLTAEKVARSITGVWIGQRYIDKVRAELQSPDSPGYDLRRNVTLVITQQQMQSAALECQQQGHLSSADLQWLERSIASLGETSPQTRHRYAVHRLMIDGEWVIDTWLFSHGDNPVLLYTPQAPDGISFRQARRFNYLLKKQPGMLAYLTRRVGVQSQTRVRAFLEDAKQQLPEQLDSTSVSPARYDSTRSVAPVPDLRNALYNMKLQRKIDDVAATTVNRAQMIGGILWTCIEWVTAIATAPFPILSLSAGLLLAFKDAMLALHAYNQGDTSAALDHFAGYLLNSAGALFTDLRPALHSLKPVGRSLRLSSAGAEQSRAMQLIHQLEPAALPPTQIRPVMFEGRALWTTNTPDAIGRYLLYRLDPHGQLASTGRLVTPDADGILVRSGVSGGGPKYQPVQETPGPHKDYGIPAKHRDQLESVMDPQFRTGIVDMGRSMFPSAQPVLDSAVKQLSNARIAYLQQVERLTTDARAFFRDYVPLPAVTQVPPVPTDLSMAQWLASDTFSGNKSLIIGAVPGSIASKQLLIAHLDGLIEKGFKRLYVEYLPGDVFPIKLEKLNSGKSWQHIENHLKAMDKALGYAPDAEYSYLALVRKARDKGLQIRALDASTCYQLEDVLLMGESSPATPKDNGVRNFYSHKVIAADAADAPDERWIALVEQSRLRTFKQTPGLADLQDAVALRVEDVGLDQPAGLWVDTPGAIPGDALAKGDYRMTLPTAYKAPEPSTPPAAIAPEPSVQHFSDFDIDPSLREDIARLSSRPHGLDSRYAPLSQSGQGPFEAFLERRSNLNTTAERFFADYVPPARPALPEITASTTAESFLRQVADSPLTGLVIGEAHAHESSKALLRKQMKNLKKMGFKTLYVEHLLTDLHQAHLDAFHLTQRMPNRLKAYLRNQDAGHMGPFYSGPDTYSQVIQAAGKYGIRVRALDCTASYHIKGMDNGDLARNQMFSYFAAQVIRADQATQGQHKWIAFVGSAHTNNNLGVPGLAEMLGAASLHVRDTALARARSIHRGFWETDLKSLTTRALRSDYTLEVGIAGMPRPAAIVPVDRSRLIHAGHYLIERPSTAEINLLHKSKNGDIVSTPIEIDDNGLFFINRWVKQARRFKYLLALLDMLEQEVSLVPAP